MKQLILGLLLLSGISSQANTKSEQAINLLNSCKQVVVDHPKTTYALGAYLTGVALTSVLIRSDKAYHFVMKDLCDSKNKTKKFLGGLSMLTILSFKPDWLIPYLIYGSSQPSPKLK